MKTATVLVATVFALTSFPFLGQQPPADSSTNSPAQQQAAPPDAQPAQSPDAQPTQPPEGMPSAPGAPSRRTASPESAPAEAPATEAATTTAQAPLPELHPVQAELVSKLDTKTAKTGDSVVVQTKSAVKTADGTEIPKGSKLVGRVIGVQPSASGTDSQVALQFDHAELTGGQSLPIHSEIQSIGGAKGGQDSASNSEPASGDAMGAPRSSGSAAGAAPANGAAGSAATTPGYAPGYTPGTTGNSSSPAAGTIVARNGKIAIKTTSIPGVLLASNAPGEQDPRMERASGILLGAKQDVQLDGGTQMVLGVSATSGGGQ
jgi:hypothetical protein